MTPVISSSRCSMAFPPQQRKALLPLLYALRGPCSHSSNELGDMCLSSCNTLEGTLPAYFSWYPQHHVQYWHLEGTQMFVEGTKLMIFNKLPWFYKRASGKLCPWWKSVRKKKKYWFCFIKVESEISGNEETMTEKGWLGGYHVYNVIKRNKKENKLHCLYPLNWEVIFKYKLEQMQSKEIVVALFSDMLPIRFCCMHIRCNCRYGKSEISLDVPI